MEMFTEAVAVKTAGKVIDSAAPGLMARIGKRAVMTIDRVKVQYVKTFQDHIASSLFRAKLVRTVISKDRPIDLESIYVPLTLRCDDDEQIVDIDMDPCAIQGSRIIISGTGGAGKTVLMKKLFINSVDNRFGLVPLFIELRNVDVDNYKDLSQALNNYFCDEGQSESLSLFQAGLEEGLFTLFLDGFDEINPDLAQKAIRMIGIFSRRYRKCSIVISTRPGTGVHSLVNYLVYHVNPLTKQQALDLVKKTKFEEISKSKFIKELDSSLYDKHQTMMSIPILIVMMLLTFRTYGSIPNRMTVFYSQAFDTLYSIHDAEGKESYKRIHSSDLPPDIFRKILNTFCYTSLCNYEIEFSNDTLTQYIGNSIRYCQIDCSPEAYISDLVKNVCVLQPDGVSYLFVHRSFQEYFAASFASRYSGKRQFKVYDQLISVTGSVIVEMLSEIDLSKLNRQWTLPKLEKFVERVESFKSLTAYEKLSRLTSAIFVYSNEKVRDLPISGIRELSNDSNLLSHADLPDISARTLISQMKLNEKDYKRLFSRTDTQVDQNAGAFVKGKSKTLYLDSRVGLRIDAEHEDLISRSNFNTVYDQYRELCRTALEALKDRVAKDVEIEDVLFGELD